MTITIFTWFQTQSSVVERRTNFKQRFFAFRMIFSPMRSPAKPNFHFRGHSTLWIRGNRIIT
jgi:hypothetical protein